MPNGDPACVGLLQGGGVNDDILREMLEHQGVPYYVINEASLGTGHQVVIAPKSSVALDRMARVGTPVVVAEREVDLGRIFRYLSGLESAKTDVLEPFVNIEEEKLIKAIKSVLEGKGKTLTTRPFWPGNAAACCVLTHDIDWLTYSPFHKVVLGGNLGPKSLLNLLVGGVRGKNYGWNFEIIENLEERFGSRSSYFFMSGYPDGYYNLRAEIEHLQRSGWEVGLHGSEGSHLDRGSLNSEWKKFQDSTGVRPRGIRQHILKFKVPKTWEIAADEEFEYDATFSYNRLFGFKGGVCLPYHPLSATGRLSITELPTSFMDFTALNRGLRGEAAKGRLRELAEIVEKHHGVLVVNFHNTYLNSQTFPDVVALYEDLLKLLKERKYWVATARQCVQWWNQRTASQISLDRASNQVACDSKEYDVALEPDGNERTASTPTRQRSEPSENTRGGSTLKETSER